MAEDRERETGAVLVGVEDVLGTEEVGLDLVESAVEIQVEARVVQGAVLHLPVVAGVAQYTVVQGRQGFWARGGERVQGAVAAPCCSRPSSVPLGAMTGSNMEVASHQAVDATGIRAVP